MGIFILLMIWIQFFPSIFNTFWFLKGIYQYLVYVCLYIYIYIYTCIYTYIYIFIFSLYFVIINVHELIQELANLSIMGKVANVFKLWSIQYPSQLFNFALLEAQSQPYSTQEGMSILVFQKNSMYNIKQQTRSGTWATGHGPVLTCVLIHGLYVDAPWTLETDHCLYSGTDSIVT